MQIRPNVIQGLLSGMVGYCGFARFLPAGSTDAAVSFGKSMIKCC